MIFYVKVFMVRGIFAKERFLSGEKRHKRSTSNFINTFLPDFSTKECPNFSNSELFIFYCNTTSFQIVFCTKKMESSLLKNQKIFKRKKIAGTLLYLSWFATFRCEKMLKTTMLLV